MNKTFNNFWAFLFFKTKPVTQVFITDIQAKIWKSLYAFIFVWICIYFSVYKFLRYVSVIRYIKNYPAFYGKYRLMKITPEFCIHSNSYKHNALTILHFLSQGFSSYLPVNFVYFVKSRLFFNISRISKIQNAKFFEYCFCMNTNYREIFKFALAHL